MQRNSEAIKKLIVAGYWTKCDTEIEERINCTEWKALSAC